jgi:EAL domain-containing protein (putative c-di-GMP-specific phosphodiesterase class I)
MQLELRTYRWCRRRPGVDIPGALLLKRRHQPRRSAIVRAIVGLAEAFGLQLVAEGVETLAAAQTLIDHRCHRVQGFLFSRPAAGDAMESLLSTRSMQMLFLAEHQD